MLINHFTAIDFETANYDANSACSVGMVKVEEGEIVDEFISLIRPPSREFRFTHIHGLTWEDVQEAPNFKDIWPAMKVFIGSSPFLVAHNAPFDRKVLLSSLEANGIGDTPPEFRCTVQVARHKLKIKPAKLSNVCDVLGIELDHHEALSDARASAQVMIHAYRQSADNAVETGI